jgi:hypothetical protein
VPAVQRGHQRPRGLFLGYPHRDRLDEIFRSERYDQVRVIGVRRRAHPGSAISAGGWDPDRQAVAVHRVRRDLIDRTLPIMLDVDR